jgi:hypothetical protein
MSEEFVSGVEFATDIGWIRTSDVSQLEFLQKNVSAEF